MKRLFIFNILLLLIFGVNAQETIQSRIGFSYTPGNYPPEITESVARTLENKVNQIISRSCAGASIASSAAFAIRPEITITSSDVVSTGMRGVYVTRGELTLYAVGLLDNNTYSSVRIAIEGSASNSQDAAINQMIARVNITDVRIVRFIQTAQQQIEQFFAKNTPILMQKAETLAKKGQYEQAVAVLSLIPESVDSYPTVATRISEYYTAQIDLEATAQMHEVDVLLVQGKKNEALDILTEINPLSTLFPQAKAKINSIYQEAVNARKAIKEKEEMERNERLLQKAQVEKERKEEEQRNFDNQMKLEKMRLEAAIRGNSMGSGNTAPSKPAAKSSSSSSSSLDSLRDCFKTINIFN